MRRSTFLFTLRALTDVGLHCSANELNKLPKITWRVELPSSSGEALVEGCRELCATAESDDEGPICVQEMTTYANFCWFRCSGGNQKLPSKAMPRRGTCDDYFVSPTKSNDEKTNVENLPLFYVNSKCASACSDDFQPVCGETGETFTNECLAKCSIGNLRYAQGFC